MFRCCCRCRCCCLPVYGYPLFTCRLAWLRACLACSIFSGREGPWYKRLDEMGGVSVNLLAIWLMLPAPVLYLRYLFSIFGWNKGRGGGGVSGEGGALEAFDKREREALFGSGDGRVWVHTAGPGAGTAIIGRIVRSDGWRTFTLCVVYLMGMGLWSCAALGRGRFLVDRQF